MSHLQEIDRAVLLARRAAAAGPPPDPRRLSRFLYDTWYLGGSAPRQPGTSPPAPRQGDPWRVWGPLWADRPSGGSDLVRLSLTCAPHRTLHAVAAAVTRLRGWDVPWLLRSRAVGREAACPDGTAVYLPADAVSDLRTPIEALVDDLRPFLAEGVPALTLRIGRGAALAQNAADGRSHGEHRCSVLAHAVVDNLDHPHPLVVQRTLSALRLAGVDPRRPYRALDASWQWERRGASVA